jgi:hypothetical protein
MSIHQSTPSLDETTADSNLPRRLWRQLLLKPPVPVGGAALVVGTKPIVAAERLAEFGLEVLALCDDPAAVLEGRLRCPQADFQRFDSAPLARLEPHAFDLALVLDTSAWPANLLGRAARQLSATVLATVKPGRRLLWRHQSADKAAHDAGCWFRHLACFPGAIDVQSVSVPRWPLTVFRPVRRRETTVVELTTPNEPIAPLEWRRCVEKGLLTDRRSCCGAAIAMQNVRVA